MRLLLVLAAIVLSGCAGYMSEPANTKLHFAATLNGTNELPPNASPAKGNLTASYLPSTRILQWRLGYSGLSGPVTWAHLYGPDGVGNEAAIVPLNLQLEGNPHPGGATLTDQQAADLIAGRWSINLRTEQYPDGEIRGPIVPNAR